MPNSLQVYQSVFTSTFLKVFGDQAGFSPLSISTLIAWYRSTGPFTFNGPDSDLIDEDFSTDPGWSEVGDVTVTGGELVAVSTGGSNDAATTPSFTQSSELWASVDYKVDSGFSISTTGQLANLTRFQIGGSTRVAVDVINSSGTLKFQTRIRNDTGSDETVIHDSPVFTAATSYSIVMRYLQATTDVASDGGGQIWINQELTRDSLDIDNFDTTIPNQLTVGLDTTGTSVEGTARIDNVTVGSSGESPASVTQWNDLSGTGNDAVQTTASRQPQFEPSNSDFNDQPAVFFNDSDNGLVGAFVAGTTHPFTVFAVWDTDSIGGGGFGRIFDTGTVFNPNFAQSSATTLQMNAGGQISYTKGFTPYSPLISSVLFNTLNSEIRENGVQEASGDSGTQTFDTSGITIGNSSTFNRGRDGSIAELLVYDKELTDDEHNQIGNYLADKYGQTWTTVFTPSSFSPEVLLDVTNASSVILNGSDVSDWINQGSEGDAVQATAADQPFFDTVEPAIDFDGVSEFLATAAYSGAFTQPVTIFVVAKRNVQGVNESITDNSGIGNFVIQPRTFNTYTVNAGTSLNSSDATDTNFNIIAVQYNTTNSNIFKNGGPATNGDVGSNTMEGLTIGSNNGGTTNFLNGSVKFVFVKNTLLTDDEMNQMGNYLADRFSLTWTDITDDPDSVSDLVAWYDAAVGITLNGADVSAWAVTAGTASDLAQATAAKQPFYDTTGATPKLTFDGTDDALVVTFGASISQPYTLFIVMQETTVSGGAIFDAPDFTDRAFFRDNVGNYQIGSTSNRFGGTPDTALKVALIEYNTSSSLFFDGGTAVASGSTGTADLAGIILGGAANAGTSDNKDVSIFEVVTYDKALTTAEQNRIGNYLANKHGTTWTDIS